MTGVTAALAALATFRLTRLVTADTITEGARRWAGGVRPWNGVPRLDRPRTFEFITCPWCTSVWIGAAVAASTWAWAGPMLWVNGALAFSAVAGLLSTWGGGD